MMSDGNSENQKKLAIAKQTQEN